MADVTIRGVTYTGVAKLDLDKSGGGSVLYYDTEDADAVAADLLRGKKAYGSSGLITGTHDLPSGSISITDNGSVDVTDYATALVNVQSGGGGPTAADAILLVTVPAASTITASKGAETLVPTLWVSAADSTLEKALFVIESSLFDSSTPWTVTATKGTNTASTTVLIDSNKEFEATLTYQLILFENGEWASETGGVTSTNCTIVDGDLRSIGNYSSVGKWCTINQIDVSKYTTLCMLSKVAAGSSSRRMWFGTSDSNSIPSSDSSWGASLFTAYYSNVFSAAEADYTLKTADISAASALSYIKFGYYQQTLTKRIWLE